MKTYSVRTGGFEWRYECPYPASPEALAILALSEAAARGEHRLGVLLEVSGAQFGPSGSDEALYLSTERTLQLIGRMEQTK